MEYKQQIRDSKEIGRVNGKVVQVHEQSKHTHTHTRSQETRLNFQIKVYLPRGETIYPGN